MAVTFSVIGVLIGLVLLVIFVFKGANPVAAVPICAIIVTVFSGLPLVDTMLTTFPSGFANMVSVMGMTIISGAFFGKCLIDSGSALSIADWMADTFGAERVTWVVLIGVTILSYGGMGWGAFISLYPIGHLLCSKANYSRDILVGTIVGASWTYAMHGPFAPTPTNQMMMAAFGTTSTAGLIPGLATSIFMFFAIGIYCSWQAKRWRAKGRGFDSQEALERDLSTVRQKKPHLVAALAPIVAVLIIFNVFKIKVPAALFLGGLICIIINFNVFESPKQWFTVINKGAQEGVGPLINLAIVGGFGAVVAITPFFALILDIVRNIRMHPYVLTIFVGELTALVLGSASSAVALTNTTIGPLLMEMTLAGGYDLGNVHRLLTLAACGCDSLPHNGTLVSLNAQFGTKHRDTYFPVFITSVVIPIVGVSCICLPLALLGFK